MYNTNTCPLRQEFVGLSSPFPSRTPCDSFASNPVVWCALLRASAFDNVLKHLTQAYSRSYAPLLSIRSPSLSNHLLSLTPSTNDLVVLLRRSDNIRIPSIALSLTLVALFASTTTYSVYTLLRTRSSILNDFLFSPNLLWRIPYGSLEIPGPELFKDYTVAQQCAGTTALTINVCVSSSRSAHSPFC